MTHAAHEGMNLEWFKEMGLYSLTANYGYPLRKPPNTRDVRWVVREDSKDRSNYLGAFINDINI
jgi:hypothetical protein